MFRKVKIGKHIKQRVRQVGYPITPEIHLSVHLTCLQREHLTTCCRLPVTKEKCIRKPRGKNTKMLLSFTEKQKRKEKSEEKKMEVKKNGM